MKNLFYDVSKISLSIEDDKFIWLIENFSVFHSKNISTQFIESGCKNIFEY